MLALSLWRPWPYTFFYLPDRLRKGLENRSWPPPKAAIGQRIALHAGKHYEEDDAGYIAKEIDLPLDVQGGPPVGWLHEGIIGTVKVIGYVHAREGSTLEEARRWKSVFPPTFDVQRALDGQDRWFFGPYAWVCVEPRLLPAPVPCRGHQGLWDLRRELKPEQIRALEAA